MSEAWVTGRSEVREMSRNMAHWQVEAHEALGQVAPAKAAQQADAVQWEIEYWDWHDNSPAYYEEWLAEKKAEEAREAWVNSVQFQDMAFARMYKEW